MNYIDWKIDYCFVATKSDSIINKLSKTNVPVIYQKASRHTQYYFLSSRNISDPFFLSVINDQDDFSVESFQQQLSRGQFIHNTSDSLVSISYAGDSFFGCATDFWGILTHYWTKDKDTFICSNNIFFVAYLCENGISQEVLFEYLFFLTPLKEKTWFSDIKRLRPSQSLIYDYKNHAISISRPLDLANEMLNKDSKCERLEEAIDHFFCGAARCMNDRLAALCFSAGTDSSTVLACLRNYNIPLKTFSFGSSNYVETQEIIRLTNRINVPSQLIDISDLSNQWHETFYKTTFLSNGLVNPYRTHYFNLYNAIPPDYVIFEGTLGSQYIKGDMPVNSVISEYHLKVIKEGASIEHVIDTYFSCVDDDFRKNMREYIVDCYAKDLLNIKTDQGFRNFQSYAFEYMPSRVFSGLFLIALENHSMYLPFLSKNILNSVYKKKAGFATQSSIGDDHLGLSKLKTEASIVRFADKELYKSVLSGGCSFKEVLEFPEIFCKAIRKFRFEVKKWKYKNYFRGQIDNTKIFSIVAEYVKQHDLTDIPLKDPTSDKNIIRAAANISIIREILHDMNSVKLP